VFITSTLRRTVKGYMYILHGILGKHVDYRVCRGDTWFHDRKKIIEDCI